MCRRRSLDQERGRQEQQAAGAELPAGRGEQRRGRCPAFAEHDTGGHDHGSAGGRRDAEAVRSRAGPQDEEADPGHARHAGDRGTRGRALTEQGGGEDCGPGRCPRAAPTESWPPNAAKATRLLHPDEPPLPFADEAFDLVTSRHPATVWRAEIARVLRPGGTYFAQHVGPASVCELDQYLLGPLPEEARRARHPDRESAEARAAGLEVADVRLERLRTEFFDIGAVVYFLRKVIWIVPGFTVDRYRDRLRGLHQLIGAEGVFPAHSSRFLIKARKPRTPRLAY